MIRLSLEMNKDHFSAGQFKSSLERNVSVIPEHYLKVITPMVYASRGYLEQGAFLQPMAFIGHFASRLTLPVMLDKDPYQAERQVAEAICLLPDDHAADFVFVLMEILCLRPEKAHRFESIMAKHGSLAHCPVSWRNDVVSFSLQTRHSVWNAHAPIKPKGLSKKKRTIDIPEFRLITDSKGRFVDLLPNAEPVNEGRTPVGQDGSC